MYGCKFAICGAETRYNTTPPLFSIDMKTTEFGNVLKWDKAGYTQQPIKCGLPTIPKEDVCVLHKCKVEDCYNFRVGMFSEKLFNFCKMHTCSCYGCNEKRIEKKDFCVKHKCVFCDSIIATNQTHVCKLHLKMLCSVAECEKLVLKNEIGQSYEFCEVHACEKCKYRRRDKESKFCNTCKCDVGGCVKSVFGNAFSRLCEDHSKTFCNYANGTRACLSTKCEYSNYCEKHACKFLECQNNIVPSERIAAYGSKIMFCDKHAKVNSLCRQYGFELDALVVDARTACKISNEMGIPVDKYVISHIIEMAKYGTGKKIIEENNCNYEELLESVKQKLTYLAF